MKLSSLDSFFTTGENPRVTIPYCSFFSFFAQEVFPTPWFAVQALQSP